MRANVICTHVCTGAWSWKSLAPFILLMVWVACAVADQSAPATEGAPARGEAAVEGQTVEGGGTQEKATPGEGEKTQGGERVNQPKEGEAEAGRQKPEEREGKKGTEKEKEKEKKVREERPEKGMVLLFDAGMEYADDLDSRYISPELRRVFGSHGVYFSDIAMVWVEERGTRWIITDHNQRYILVKEGVHLNVYRETLTVRKVQRPDFNVEPLKDLVPFGYNFFDKAPQDFAPVAETPVPANYTLGPGDRLQVRFWSPVHAETVYNVDVKPDGQAYIPVVGLLTLQGLNFEQARKLITDSIAKYYRDVTVEVTPPKLRTLRVFVDGEARRPGGYTVSALSTAFNALYVAGGPSARGSLRGIRLVRNGREAGTIDLYKYLLTGDRTEDYQLQQGDTLFIPVVGPMIAVYGEVKRPALYELRGGERLRDALELAGGTRSSTFLGRVQLDRIENNVRRTILDVNIAEAYAHDDNRSNPALRDGDMVGLFPVPSRRTGSVQIDGPVQRPGTYQIREGMRVSDLIAAAQGLRNDLEVYRQRADILRVLPDTRVQIIPVDLMLALRKDPAKDTLLQEYDKLTIYTGDQVPLYGYVEIQGNVERPGLYQRTVGMKVSDLLFLSGMPRVQTYRERADLFRTHADESKEIIPVSLAKIQAGDAPSDVELQDRDVLRVYTMQEAEARWNYRWVNIDGAVQRPGRYPRQDNMTLRDLIFYAGGLLPEAAAEAEIARPRGDNQTDILNSDLDALYKQRDERQNVYLQDRDRVLVKKREEYVVEPATVDFSGEFKLPGRYSMTGKEQSLRELLQRAGGFTGDAFLEGAVFTRRLDRLVGPGQQAQAEKIKEDMEAITRKKYEAYVVSKNASIPPSLSAAAGSTGTAYSQASEMVAAAAPGKSAAVARAIGPTIPSQRVAVDLQNMLNSKDSRLDISMKDGDTLYIPKRPTTVMMAGALVNPGPLLYAGTHPVSYYVQRTGGYAADAEPSRSVIIRANGLVYPARKATRMQLGDILVVPTKPMIFQEPKNWLSTFGQFAGIVANVASTAYILLSIHR